MTIFSWIWEILNNERGSGGGGDSKMVTELPEPTEQQKELNKSAIELAKMQADEAKRQGELAKKYAPEQEAILQKQLEAGAQRLDLAKNATTALQESFKTDEYEQMRSDLRKQLAEQTLASIKGERPGVTKQQQQRLDELSGTYKTETTKGVTSIQDEFERLAKEESNAEGLRPSANLFSKSQSELRSQININDASARMLSLEKQLQLPLQNLQDLEQQREFAEQLGQKSQLSDYDALLRLSGAQIPAYGTLETITPTSIPNVLAQMQQEREKLTSQNTIGASGNRTTGAVTGAATGAGTGAMIGTAILPVVGTLIGAGVGAIAGGIFGYNA